MTTHNVFSNAVVQGGQAVLPAPAQGLHEIPASGSAGLVELLWHERRVESFGVTHRISVPLAGRPFIGPTSRLSELLTQWWSEPGRLSNGTAVSFVSADIVADALQPPELVLTLTTLDPAGEAQVANLRTIRDLRRALRELRRAAHIGSGMGLAVA